MRRPAHVDLFVVAVVAVAIALVAAAYRVHTPFPGTLAVGSFFVIAILLDQSRSRLRIAATGSTSFIMHLSAGILFGGFWGALVAGSSTLVSEVARKNAPRRVVFNVAQRSLSIAVAVLAYRLLRGHVPPSFFEAGHRLDPDAVQRDLLLFFVFALVYFLVNSVAVSAAVTLSSDRSFREVWAFNSRGLVGYDLGASSIALFISWLYIKCEQWLGTGSGAIGPICGILPIIVVRHIYGLYHQLQDSGQELLQVMVKAIEARDPYTSGHSLRVSRLSRTIATELGLSAGEIEQVETAALLHDVGKIHEEFAPLLRKESRLSPEETALMQTHAIRSAELVGIISKFRGAIHNSVRHHHERWDGAGYPDGLQARDIPLGARIILISDTIDAMTTDRPYRKRLTLEVVVSELVRCKGTQFDPDLVDHVVSSVAVRRLITEPSAEESPSMYSRRVPWPRTGRWLVRRA